MSACCLHSLGLGNLSHILHISFRCWLREGGTNENVKIVRRHLAQRAVDFRNGLSPRFLWVVLGMNAHELLHELLPVLRRPRNRTDRQIPHLLGSSDIVGFFVMRYVR